MMSYLQENETFVDSPGVTAEAVRRELKQVLLSRHFRSSKRSQQFLEYVVEQKLSGNEAMIKERLIGIELFGRDNNYVTGDDPVVRVQAGEVRRRLERYLSESSVDEGIRIELPTGTYVPLFRQRRVETEWSAEEPAAEAQSSQENEENRHEPAADMAPRQSLTAVEMPVGVVHEQSGRGQKHYGNLLAMLFVALILGGIAGYWAHAPQRTPDAVVKFWGPILASPKSVVINLGKPFVYIPSGRLFDEYAKSHPGMFAKGVDRHNQLLPLNGDTPIRWSDMNPVSNSGPAVGGVRASLTLSSFLGKYGKSFAVRFGDEGSFLEMRDAPSIIVGAMNNGWTTDMDSNFHFRIRDNNSFQYIEEAGTKRTWRAEYATEHEAKDYALITRQPVGATGHFLLKIAGLQDGGTEAASELVTNPEMLQSALRGLPSDWQSKNLQIVVETDVIERKAGPPQVLAYYVW